MLDVLADNGGATMTHALLCDSPARDLVASATNGCGSTYSTDQRGVLRPAFGACDVGAFEFGEDIDTDMDGVTDGCDQCPNTALGMIVGADGCPPPGEECVSALTVTAGSNLGTLDDNTGATGEDDACGIFNTVDEWLVYTAPITGTVTFSTCNENTGFDTVLSLWDGCAGSGGSILACTDDTDDMSCDIFGERLLSEFAWDVIQGETYYLRLSVNFDAFEPVGPSYELTIEETPVGCMRGDVDGNGSVTIDDVAPFVAIVLDPSSANEDQQCTADVNEDESINGLDLQAFLDVLTAP